MLITDKIVMGFVVRQFFRLLAALPFGVALGIARGVIQLRSVCKPDPSWSNWEKFFGGDVGAQERYRRWKPAHRRYLARLLLEAARKTWLEKDELVRPMEVRGEEHVRNALAQGRGVVLLSGHCGAWWLVTAYLGAQGHPITLIGKPLESSARSISNEAAAARYGVRLVYRGSGAARAAMRALRSNHVLHVVGDALDPSGAGRWFEFGRGAIRINRGPFALAARHGSPVLHASCELLPAGKARLVIEPVHLERDAHKQLNPAEVTRRWLTLLEGEVQARPEQWWMWRLQHLGARTESLKTRAAGVEVNEPEAAGG